jgi:hypothetical protein
MIFDPAKFVLIGGCILALCSGVAMADPEVTPPPPAAETPVPPVSAPAPIVQPVVPVRQELRVRQLQAIEFGVFSGERGGGSITVSPTGSRSVRGNVSIVGAGGGGPAEFEILGQPGEIVTIYLPERAILSRNSGNAEAVITNLKVSPEGSITLDSQGRARIKVGGTLQVPGVISSGSYNGSFDLDVRYLR